MKTKVTLSMDKEFVEEAKKLAKLESKSLSAFMMDSVNLIRQQREKDELRSRALERLKGSVIIPDSEANKEWDDLRWDALKARYNL